MGGVADARPRPRRRRPHRALDVVAWLATAGLGTVAAVRLLDLESRPVLIAVVGLVPWLLLPAYPLVALAVVRRQAALAVAGLVLVAAHLVWAVPDLGRRSPAAVPHGATTIRLVSANLLTDNPDIDRLAAALGRSDADVLVVQELSPANLAALDRAGVLAAYPHQVLDARPGYHGSAILSRLALSDGAVIDVAGSPMTRATVTVGGADGPGTALRLVNVHTVAPLDAAGTVTWRAQLTALADLTDGLADPADPADAADGLVDVLVGDFNATLQHRGLRHLVDGGLDDAFTHAGTGLGATWPARGAPLPVMRLDHVLVDEAVVVTGYANGPDAGSDHRSLVVDLAVAVPAGSVGG
jgi:endonuclease/exonuclease/phosphatase (EEP) superfamily protein YafD